MKKITIFGLHLGYGGIEKCIVTFANNMCDKYDITIVSVYKLYDKPIYDINPKVKIIYLINNNIALRVDKYKKLLKQKRFKKLFSAIFNEYIKRGMIIKLFKDVICSYKIVKEKKNKTISYIKNMDTDISISTRDFLNELVGLYSKKNTLKIAWEHNYGDEIYINSIIDTCNNIDKLVVVSKSLQKKYNDIITKRNMQLKCIYIPNTLDFVPTLSSDLKNKKLITVGRLAKEKGYLDLIDVFRLIHNNDENVTLDLIGDGDQKELIEEKIKKYNLSSRVTLKGFRDKEYINKALSNSSLFLMTSYTESFGIVLIEAMSNGVPCIAFSSAEGANEIIENDKNGYIINNRNKQEMANKVIELLNNKSKLKQLGIYAKECSKKYTKDKVYSMWIDILK